MWERLVRITLGGLFPLCSHVEPLLCVKYLPWPSSTVPGYIIRATIHSKAKVLLFLKIVGYEEYCTFLSLCLMIQEAHTIASAFSPTKLGGFDQVLGPALPCDTHPSMGLDPSPPDTRSFSSLPTSALPAPDCSRAARSPLVAPSPAP